MNRPSDLISGIALNLSFSNRLKNIRLNSSGLSRIKVSEYSDEAATIILWLMAISLVLASVMSQRIEPMQAIML